MVNPMTNPLRDKIAEVRAALTPFTNTQGE